MTVRLSEAAGIGRVALRVADADGTAAFYERALGLVPLDGITVEGRGVRDGARTRWLGTPDGDPLVGLVDDPAAGERGQSEAGLFHAAIRVPTREALAGAVVRLRAAGAQLTGASDHLVSEAVYLDDPEGNGLEVYRDRPREEWEETAEGVRMATLPLDLADLVAGVADPPEHVPPGTDVGHVHLEATDLAESVGFYRDRVGMGVRFRQGEAASFLAAGEYHHHVGLNRWGNRSEPAGEDTRGIAWFELSVPAAEFEALRAAFDGEIEGGDSDGFVVRDPDGIRVLISSQ